MHHEELKYPAGGATMHGRLYWDNTRKGTRPGVLVFPEGLGISEHTYGFAMRLAEQGYAALACDYFGGGHTSKGNGFDAETGKRFQELSSSNANVRARAKGAYDALTARPEVDKSKIAAIGYCFGGTMALELAFSGTPIAAAVGFHSGINTLAMSDVKNVKGRLLICLGADDPYVPPDHRLKFEQDMKGTGVNWQINLYGGQVHSFTNPKADARGDLKTSRYDAYTDQDSWHAMLRLFKAAFGS